MGNTHAEAQSAPVATWRECADEIARPGMPAVAARIHYRTRVLQVLLQARVIATPGPVAHGVVRERSGAKKALTQTVVAGISPANESHRG